MPKDRFNSYTHGPGASALGSYAITPSDSADLPETIRAVTIGGAGTLSWLADDGEVYHTAALPPGTYALKAARIMAAGTSATDITGWA